MGLDCTLGEQHQPASENLCLGQYHSTPEPATDGKTWVVGREGIHYRAFVSVPEPRGTAVGAQNKRDHVAAACSTELSTT